jgi:hypothetical protein
MTAKKNMRLVVNKERRTTVARAIARPDVEVEELAVDSQILRRRLGVVESVRYNAGHLETVLDEHALDYLTAERSTNDQENALANLAATMVADIAKSNFARDLAALIAIAERTAARVAVRRAFEQLANVKPDDMDQAEREEWDRFVLALPERGASRAAIASDATRETLEYMDDLKGTIGRRRGSRDAGTSRTRRKRDRLEKIASLIAAVRDSDLGDDRSDPISIQEWNRATGRAYSLVPELTAEFPDLTPATLRRYVTEVLRENQ